MKFRLQNKLPQAICGHNNKPVGMPDITTVTEIAGSVCVPSLGASALLP
jgi:hypothetical protein